MRTLLTLLLLGATVSAAPVPKELKRDPFVGKWNLKQQSFNGGVPADAECGIFWHIDAHHTLTFSVATPAKPAPVVKANALAPARWVVTSTGPDTIQLRIDTLRKNIEHGMGNLARTGKYSLDGDTLTICLSFHGSPRPETTAPRANTQVWTFERVAE